jgi:hypothetical protein
MALVDFSLGDIGNLFTSLREAITGKKIEDPVEQAKIELQLQQLEHALKMGQIEINKAEANNPNWFVAGWRPFIGWIGGLSLAYTFIISPLIQWGCKLYGLNIIPPVLDTSMLFNLVLAMLGLGGLRTIEKTKKVQDLH